MRAPFCFETKPLQFMKNIYPTGLIAGVKFACENQFLNAIILPTEYLVEEEHNGTYCTRHRRIPRHRRVNF